MAPLDYAPGTQVTCLDYIPLACNDGLHYDTDWVRGAKLSSGQRYR